MYIVFEEDNYRNTFKLIQINCTEFDRQSIGKNRKVRPPRINRMQLVYTALKFNVKFAIDKLEFYRKNDLNGKTLLYVVPLGRSDYEIIKSPVIRFDLGKSMEEIVNTHKKKGL